MNEPAHHHWGPSSLKQRINCLGSSTATEGMPDSESEAALSGTASHRLVETCRELNVPAESFRGRTIDVIGIDGKNHEFLVDQARIDSAQTFIDHINALPGMDFNEQRIHYPRFIPGGFGTLDAARANDGIVYIRDFKDGKLLVHAKDNEQLLGCALGFLEDYGHLFDIREFNLGIVQPRRGHVDVWENVSVARVREWARNVLTPAFKRAYEPNPPFKAGDWCTFCKIRGTCKTRAASAFETAVGEFDDLDEAIEKSGKVAFTGQLSNEQVARILPAIPAMKAWCNDLEKYAFGQVRAGLKVGDFKIIEGSLGDRKFISGAEPVIVEAAAEKADELYEPAKLKGPAQVEKVLGAKRFKPPGPPTEKKPEGTPPGDMWHLIVRPPGKPQMVPGSDPRPAMVFDAANVFDEEQEDFG